MLNKLMVKGTLKAFEIGERSRGYLRNKKGQSMIEWTLIIVLIAVVVIVLLRAVGVKIQGVLTKIIGALG